MGKFNTGDRAVIVNVKYHGGVDVGTEVKVIRPVNSVMGPGYLVELSTRPGSELFYTERRLGPIDDPLPPAPESALYNDEYHDRTAYKQTWLSAHPDCMDTLVVLQSGQYGEPLAGVGVRVSPDAALRLAHDLRRMAMELKRKEKQHG